MSAAPLFANTPEALEAALRPREREAESLGLLPPYTVIFSEGVRTEPAYIQGLVEKVNERCAPYTTGGRIAVVGTGRNTKSLLDYARRTVDACYPQCTEVWLVYDMDDFPYDDFDNTQFSAEGKNSRQNYHVAWSNVCIELWFVLHFQQLYANVTREQYREILKRYIPYDKSMPNLYDLLRDRTGAAIAHAQALYDSYGPDVPPSRRSPATRVHELVAFLSEYL